MEFRQISLSEELIFSLIFGTISTPDAWSKTGVLQDGLRHTLLAEIREQRESLAAHARVVLDGYPVALTLSLKMLSITCDWWEWFAKALTAHAKQVLDRACLGVSCTTKVRTQYWKRAMGSLSGFFLELRKVRVQATGAEYHKDFGNKHGILLYCTL